MTFIVFYNFSQNPANQRFLLINLVASAPASTAVTIPFYVFGRSMSKNGDCSVTRVATPAPSWGARGGTRSPAGVSGALRRGAAGGTVGTNAPTGTMASAVPACKIHNVPRWGNHHPCQQFIRDFSYVALRLWALKLKGVARVHPRWEFF